MKDLFFQAQVLITLVRGRADEARRQGRSDLGASAVEWAIITAIVVGLALLVAGVIREVVDNNVSEIKKGNN